MAEVISSSREPDQVRRRSPGTLLVLIAALIAATGLIGYYATRDSPAPAPSPRPTPAVPPVPAAQADPVAPAALRCGQQCDTPVLHARPGTGPRGLRLLLNTTPPTELDAAGTRARGPQVSLRRGEHVESLLPMGAGNVALVQANYVGDATPPGRVYRIGPRGSAALIGRADSLIQGMGATVWTVTYPRPSTPPPGPYTLSEIDSAGRLLARHTEPPEIQVLRATRAGLLATISAATSDGSYFGSIEKVAILNPATGRIDSVLSDSVFAVLDATASRVAWSSIRRPLVEVYDLDRRAVQGVFRAPGYHPPNYGRLSPDQRTLALGFSGLPQIGSNPASYGFLQVLDLTTGRITPINGLLTPPKDDAALDWSRDGGTVILGVDSRKQARFAFWRLGSQALTVLPTAVKHSDYSRFLFLQIGAS